jgi:hypothetical protein
LKSIAKGIVTFEEAITLLLPVERNNCAWCRSNVKESKQLAAWFDGVKTCGFRCIYDNIDAIQDHYSLCHIMSPTRCTAWNFQNAAVPEACGTVEFRRLPQIPTAEALCHWMAFTMCFIKLALDWDFPTAKNLRDPPGLPELQDGISQAASELQGTISHSLGSLEEIVDTAGPFQLSAQQEADIRKVKALGGGVAWKGKKGTE